MSIKEALTSLYRYDVIGDKPVARGGCGHIWRACDRLFEQTVAIKTIDEALLWNDSARARRTFVKEAQAGARLGRISRHVVQVTDYGFADAVPYFAMEWISPRDGRTTIDTSPDMGALSLGDAKALMFDVCAAVGAAHEHGVAHSDIAPWNVVYDPSQRSYKLADFGLLKILEKTLVSAGSGSLLVGGRADFMPLSVRLGEEDIGRASDVYAMAVTFRTLLEGPHCLGGHAIPTPPVIKVRHRGATEAPPQVRQLLLRFLDGHTAEDDVSSFEQMLQRIPG